MKKEIIVAIVSALVVALISWIGQELWGVSVSALKQEVAKGVEERIKALKDSGELKGPPGPAGKDGRDAMIGSRQSIPWDETEKERSITEDGFITVAWDYHRDGGWAFAFSAKEPGSDEFKVICYLGGEAGGLVTIPLRSGSLWKIHGGPGKPGDESRSTFGFEKKVKICFIPTIKQSK